MTKRILTLLLTLALLATCALAYSPEQYNTADALYELGLFKGRTAGIKDYALDAGLSRDEGVTLLVRMLGKEEEALAGGGYGNPFHDVPKGEWSESYVGYAKLHGITDGVGVKDGKNLFAPDRAVDDKTFLTLVLRAMDYNDKSAAPQFTWENPYTLAKQLGLIDYTTADSNFTRGEAVAIFWNALDARLNGSTKTLADRLVEQKVFTRAELNAARDIAAGILPEPETPAEPETPSTPSTPSTPDKPNTSYTYEDYLSWTPAQRQAHMETFNGNYEAYFAWHNAAKAAYDAAQKDNTITGDGNIDLGDFVKP